ncbi:CLUMA_CG012963, isoform A [Clunio marinus]|uniref:[histone H3]-lysine(36) N-trimethyltransferase n=1 Tax=Clunio marinus TaxID=568069 RepID=A0A1J1IHM6_9DIPT|nr:CLUMA_CG012963, isoform A [Clunio marinus]
MERKTRSGKVTIAPPVATVGKKKGRKKKSETSEIQPTIEICEEFTPTTRTRRSCRGKNVDLLSIGVNSDASIIDTAEDSNLSILTSDSSILNDTTTTLPVSMPSFSETDCSVTDDVDKTEKTLQIVLERVDDAKFIKKEEEKQLPVIIKEEIEVLKEDDALENLEQKFNEVVLKEESSEVPQTIKIEENLKDKRNVEEIEDVEMKEEKIEDIAVAALLNLSEIEEVKIPIAEEKLPNEESDKNLKLIPAEDEIKKEETFDYMEIDDVPFVRRSRRLQCNYMEAQQIKIDDSTSQPTPSVSVESQEELSSSSVALMNPVTTNEQITAEVTAPEKDEVPKEKIPQIQVSQEVRKEVHHMDERLKRYETIRDNIYSKKSDKKVCKVNKTMKCDCTITEEEVKNGELGCQFNCINRILYIECGAKCRCGEYCDNQQFQRYNYSACSVFDTTTKGFGIRADQDIPAETFIIEYVGEVLDNKQFEKRAKKYSENKNIHYYFMALKSNAIIDATKKGNISRFINHSCDPNAETQKWTVNGELRVGFFSRKDIKQGEEITFDYQYQRYGKEAQKCYCEATNCRGWIGENPLDEAEEEECIESPEIDETKAKKTKGRKGRQPKATQPEQELKDDSESEVDDKAVNNVKPIVKKREASKKLADKMKKRQEMYEDLEIKEEINDLTKSGLKNRGHTIRLARLVVRAKNVDARSRILKILINGDLPCRRLFLDYNGLKLLHSWMIELKMIFIPDLELCIEIMNVLETLPITNKTVLKTSKVLDRVEKWKNLNLESRLEKKQAKAEKKKNKKHEMIVDENQPKDENVVDDLSQKPDEKDKLTTLMLQVKEVASELLEKWEALKEDFKIPKKQKQEIMIVHEREADNDSWDEDSQRNDILSQDRFKNRFGDDPNQSGINKTVNVNSYKKQIDPIVSKQQRRHMFEMKMAQIDTEKRMMMLHENNCAIFGLNPQTTNPLDVPVRVNRVTGEYNTIDGRIAPPPPNHYQFKYEPLTLSTNPDDYFLPPIDLPEQWRFAIDVYGRIYYYHEKIRQSQWEAPIKILPLRVNVEGENESPDSDESTTETEDSEEEELRELLEMLKRKKQLPQEQQPNVNPSTLQTGDTDEDDLEKKIMSNMMKNPVDQPLKLSQSPQKRLTKKRSGLTTMQFIRPRTEADKIYGRAESKRYKELKEKLRQRKRRILKGEPGNESSEDEDVPLDDSVVSGKFVDELDILEKSELEALRNKKEMEKKAKKTKPVVLDQAEIRRQFRDEMLKEIAKFLQPYRDESCENGRILNDSDFNSLVSKLTYSVLTKESKHCHGTNSMLKATESVKGKTKEYIKKYMGKFEGPYQRKEDEQDYANILNKF